MKKRIVFIYIVYIFLFVSGSIYGVGENTINIGGSAAWNMVESRNGVAEAHSVRPHPVLVLSSATGISTAGYSAATGVLGNFTPLTESSLDLSVSFDENNASLYRDSIGHYRVLAPPEIESVDRRRARAGTGAALFNGTTPITIEPQNRNALFVSGNRIRDFTIEFWIYPLNLENGEQVFQWVSTRPQNGDFLVQQIQCAASRNRLQWSFNNFFASTDDSSYINIDFSGTTPVVPRTWSHHLIRFDATTGMIEYLVNGNSEAVVYTTSTRREPLSSRPVGEVFTPITGNNGVFMLGARYMGLIDEFKIHNVCAGRSSIQKYVPSGGRMETRAIDLGGSNSGVIRIDASGGNICVRNTNVNNVNNEFRENGRFRFSDDSEMNFFIRSSDNPYLLNESSWRSFTPGVNITGVQGRYVQIAVDFYPSADGEASPYLSELRIVYTPGEPPLPPRNLTVTAVDGGVLLRWRHSPSANTDGYLVYYSAVRGELFGDDALAGPSPIDAGYKNSLFIDGLKNGTLYYFTIASYDYINGTNNHNAGEFSAEVTARPLAGLSLSDISSQGLEASPVRR
jgi:hypothetical protein